MRHLLIMIPLGLSLGSAWEMAALGQPAEQSAGFDAQKQGREYTAKFYDGNVDELWAVFDKAMKNALVSPDQLRTFRQQVAGQIGEESAVISEQVTQSGGIKVYVRHARFSGFDQPIEVAWGFNNDGTVAMFFIRPVQKAAESPHLQYQTKTELRLPFAERWNVFWGGRSLAENYHAVAKDQRFAYDILALEDGSSHTGDGTSNEQYHCFGRRILAPGPGVVAEAVDGVADNKPGEMNPMQATGNHVVIDHGNGEFSFLAHFKQGSLAVKKGQAVKTGDLLGLCGNSGNSSEPHLHYHLQNTAVFQQGEGLPAQFHHYLADGKPVERGEPTKGQTIEPQPATLAP